MPWVALLEKEMMMKLIPTCFAALLATGTMAVADERISLIIGHQGAAWQARCIVNLGADGKMTTQLQLSRDSMPAPDFPVDGMDFLPDRFKFLSAAIMAGAWPNSVQEDEVWDAPYISLVYTQRDDDDVTLERRVFQKDLMLDIAITNLFAPLHDGSCLTPPQP